MAPIPRVEDIDGWKKLRALLDEFLRFAGSTTLRNGNLKDQME